MIRRGRHGGGSAFFATFLFAMVLLLAPDSALPACAETTRSSPAADTVAPRRAMERLGSLWINLHENIRDDAQIADWSDSTEYWYYPLGIFTPTTAEFRMALQELELSVRASKKAEDWDTRRIAWYSSLRRAVLPAQFADLMRQLEMALVRTAFVDAWAARRLIWHDDVSAAWRTGSSGNSSAGTTPASPAATVAPAVSRSTADSSAIARLAELITGLESSVKPDSMVGQWSSDSPAWVHSLKRATSVANLKAALQQFECSVKRATLIESWNTQRTAWYTALRAATTTAHVAVQLRQLEDSFKSEAMGRFWFMAQGFWRVQVDAVANGNYSAPAAPAPTTPVPATQTAPAPSRPTDASTAVTSGQLFKLIGLLKELEVATKPGARRFSWAAYHRAQATDVSNAPAISQLQNSMLAYFSSIQLEAMTSDESWRSRWFANWEAEVSAASSGRELATLLNEVEAALKTESLSDSWPRRRAAWRAAVTAAGTGVAATPVPSTPAPTTPVATAAPSIADLVKYLIDLESQIDYAAQVPSWKDQQRDAWIAEANGATTMEELGDVLLTLEKGFRPESFKSEWSARRAPWRSEVQRASSTVKMKALTVELERALLGSSWLADDDWY